MQNIRHQNLEPHILDTSDILSPPEVITRVVTSTFPSVVNEVFRHFSQSSSFFSEVNDDSDSSSLSTLDGFFNTKDQVSVKYDKETITTKMRRKRSFQSLLTVDKYRYRNRKRLSRCIRRVHVE